MKDRILRTLGVSSGLILGDSMVLDRWRWLSRFLPETRNEERILDVGCGTGAFSICAASRGYRTLGLSWDDRNQGEASKRAALHGLEQNARFQVFDVRDLADFREHSNEWHFVICCENIEHISNDAKLIKAIYSLLRPGGRLLITAPYYYYIPLNSDDAGPFEEIEDGRHVRKGYSEQDMRDLLEGNGFRIEAIEYCSGIWSQFFTRCFRKLNGCPKEIAWIATLPLRLLVAASRSVFTKKPYRAPYSICVLALKPRYSTSAENVKRET